MKVTLPEGRLKIGQDDHVYSLCSLLDRSLFQTISQNQYAKLRNPNAQYIFALFAFYDSFRSFLLKYTNHILLINNHYF